MNKSLIIGILIIIVGGGYFLFSGGDNVNEATSGAVETTTDAIEEAGEAMDGALFSAEGYDAEKVGGMIDASGLDENQKNGFKTALQAAVDDPAMLTSILAQVKDALGL